MPTMPANGFSTNGQRIAARMTPRNPYFPHLRSSLVRYIIVCVIKYLQRKDDRGTSQAKAWTPIDRAEPRAGRHPTTEGAA